MCDRIDCKSVQIREECDDAIDPKYADQDEFSLLSVLEETSGREMPQAIKDILNANILHDLECDADKMKDTVKNILEV